MPLRGLQATRGRVRDIPCLAPRGRPPRPRRGCASACGRCGSAARIVWAGRNWRRAVTMPAAPCTTTARGTGHGAARRSGRPSRRCGLTASGAARRSRAKSACARPRAARSGRGGGGGPERVRVRGAVARDGPLPREMASAASSSRSRAMRLTHQPCRCMSVRIEGKTRTQRKKSDRDWWCLLYALPLREETSGYSATIHRLWGGGKREGAWAMIHAMA